MKEFKFVQSADQQFGAILNGRRCTLRFRYNNFISRWAMDLAIDDGWVLTGRRVVLGVDLLAPFGFGVGKLFALTENPASNAEPDFTGLTTGLVKLYHVTDAEVEAHLNGSVSS